MAFTGAGFFGLAAAGWAAASCASSSPAAVVSTSAVSSFLISAVFRHGVPFMIGNGGPSFLFNEINGLEGSRSRR